MAFIDLLDSEYIQLLSGFMERMNEMAVKNLKKDCKSYQDEEKKVDNLTEKYEFINDVTDNRDFKKDDFSRDEMDKVKEYYACMRNMDYYERFEIYKLGFHDCLQWMKIIGIL